MGKEKPSKITTRRLACPECGARYYVYSRRERIFWCRRCGAEWSRNQFVPAVKHGGREGTDPT